MASFCLRYMSYLRSREGQYLLLFAPGYTEGIRLGHMYLRETLEMHCVNVNETPIEKAKWEEYKNAT